MDAIPEKLQIFMRLAVFRVGIPVHEIIFEICIANENLIFTFAAAFDDTSEKVENPRNPDNLRQI